MCEQYENVLREPLIVSLLLALSSPWWEIRSTLILLFQLTSLEKSYFEM